MAHADDFDFAVGAGATKGSDHSLQCKRAKLKQRNPATHTGHWPGRLRFKKCSYIKWQSYQNAVLDRAACKAPAPPVDADGTVHTTNPMWLPPHTPEKRSEPSEEAQSNQKGLN